jgi:hypothetical protein
VLPLAARIGEPEIRILNVIVLDQLQDVMGRRHWVGFPGWKKRMHGIAVQGEVEARAPEIGRDARAVEDVDTTARPRRAT